MKTKRIVPLFVAIVLQALTACNYTVGECWRRGERGEDSEGAGAGYGEGSGAGDGSGDFGDAPGEENGDEPLQCNKTDKKSKEDGPKEAPKSPTPADPCQQNGIMPPPPECTSIGIYDASLFIFKTTLADDGTDVGGGYQEATASSVRFVDTRQNPPSTWTCSVWVGMPLRTAKFGKISPERAAETASDVLTDASGITMHSRSAWIKALFCSNLRDAMNKIFREEYDGLGASARAQ